MAKKIKIELKETTLSANPTDTATTALTKIKVRGTTYSVAQGGTSDYTQLTNKPQINSVELTGNKGLSDIGAASAGDLTTHTSNTDIHTSVTEKATWNAKQNALTTSDFTSDTLDIEVIEE